MSRIQVIRKKSRGYVFHYKHRVPPLSPSSGVNGTDVTASLQKGQVDQTSGTCDTRMTHAMYKGASVILLRLGQDWSRNMAQFNNVQCRLEKLRRRLELVTCLTGKSETLGQKLEQKRVVNCSVLLVSKCKLNDKPFHDFEWIKRVQGWQNGELTLNVEL